MHCYACDEMRVDDHLAKHLGRLDLLVVRWRYSPAVVLFHFTTSTAAHFGIDVGAQTKTAKTIEELVRLLILLFTLEAGERCPPDRLLRFAPHRHWKQLIAPHTTAYVALFVT